MLDIYAVQVPTKFGHSWFRPKFICITASRHPRYWYDYLVPRNRLDEFEALQRRIHLILDFDNQAQGIWGARVPADITGDGWEHEFVFPPARIEAAH